MSALQLPTSHGQPHSDGSDTSFSPSRLLSGFVEDDDVSAKRAKAKAAEKRAAADALRPPRHKGGARRENARGESRSDSQTDGGRTRADDDKDPEGKRAKIGGSSSSIWCLS